MYPIPRAFWETCVVAGYPETLDHNHPESEGVGPRSLNNVDGVSMSTKLTYLSMARHRLNLTVRGNFVAHLRPVTPTEEERASDDSLDAWMFANVGTQNHPSGTCKIGPASDDMAVVDQYLRVYGTEGLRVVDASVISDVVRANTNASTRPTSATQRCRLAVVMTIPLQAPAAPRARGT